MSERVQVCLAMMARTSPAALRRALTSCLPLIDRYCIVVDPDEVGAAMADVVKEFFAPHPAVVGDVHTKPFIKGNFAANRNRVMDLASWRTPRPSLTYDLLLDADDYLLMPAPWPIDDVGMVTMLRETGGLWEGLDAGVECYLGKFAERARVAGDGGYVVLPDHYRRPLLVRQSSGLRYEGVAHEAIDAPPNSPTLEWPQYMRAGNSEASREEQLAKYLRDAALLEKAPRTPRNVFHLAQSYRDAGKLHRARDVYYATLDAADAVISNPRSLARHIDAARAYAFAAALEAARLTVRMKLPVGVVVGAYEIAMATLDAGGRRAEPPYELALHLRENFLDDARRHAKEALSIVEKYPPPVGLFIDRYVYESGAADLVKALG